MEFGPFARDLRGSQLLLRPQSAAAGMAPNGTNLVYTACAVSFQINQPLYENIVSPSKSDFVGFFSGGTLPSRPNKPPEDRRVAPVSLDDSPGTRRRRLGPGSSVRPTTAAPIMIMPAYNHEKSVDETKPKDDEEEGEST